MEIPAVGMFLFYASGGNNDCLPAEYNSKGSELLIKYCLPFLFWIK